MLGDIYLFTLVRVRPKWAINRIVSDVYSLPCMWCACEWALSSVHTSNNVEETGNIVEATFDFVETTFDFVATNGNNVAGFGNNVERNFVLSTKSKQIEHCQNGNNVEATFDIFERIVKLVAFNNVAWTLLLVWTRL